jgi:eukaryotic-like serine/threonine-protein kinase
MSNKEPEASLLGGKYRILDRLGGGGLGDVYRGENTLTGRPVALKILRSDFVGDGVRASRYFQDAEAANKIRHPNIVDVLDAGIGESGPFIVMECLSGDSAAAALARLGRLSVEATIAIGLDVLDALDAAHRAGIVHRDLKPGNIFLHRPMSDVPVTVKLLDFGIARLLLSAGADPRQTPVTFGTADYLSPEQALGERGTDGRSDLFSLAVVLFELLTGERPFRAATAVATAHRVVHAAQPSFAEVGSPAHPMLESILAKGLCKRRADRYATAADFARELFRVTPDLRTRAKALQDVLGNPASSPSGTQPVDHGRAASPRRSSSPPYWSPPRSSSSALRPSVSWRETERTPSGPPVEEREPGRASIPAPAPEATRSSGPPPRRESGTSPPSFLAAQSCHVRGHVLRAADHFLLGVHGTLVRDRILAQLPARFSDDFRHGSITGVVLYDLAVFEAYAAAAGAVVLGYDPSTWREIGRGSVEGELASLMRTLSRSSDEAALFRRCTTTWSRLTDFGTWNTEHRSEGEAVVQVSEFGAAPPALRQWLIGVVEQTLRHAGHPGAKVTSRPTDASRTPDLDLAISLRH